MSEDQQDMWAIHHKDGTFEQVFDVAKPKVKGATVVKLDRFGDLMLETHDPKGGWISRSDQEREANIDTGFDIDFPAHRLLDYAVKEIEAHIILGTLTTDGRLAREAQIRGIPIDKLAEMVAIKSSDNPNLTRAMNKLNAEKAK